MSETWNEQLKEWIDGEEKSIAQISREIGINYSTLKNYRNGDIKDLDSISAENRRALFHYTGLEVFRTGETESEFDLTRDLNRLGSDVKKLTKAVAIQLPYDEKLKILKTGYQPSPDERIENVIDIFYLLINELDHFKDKPEYRKKLTESLNSEHAGYLVSFLNNLYKEDKMSNWIFQMTSTPKRSKK